ncbi:uncharacterized protein LOC113093359 [Carassius auratus]|uniref:Uncharacterized protein LOC113093359 n=1 Tax=Carassius auratus TaxID=7957 RepID=A0A6P6P2F8_CARAU|nr:uncharacterized protein LOC113093359 [Carassius auratus]
MEKKVFRYQKLMRPRSEHCCVPLCVVSARYNSTVSFHSFPVEEDLRKKWLVQIRRDDFQVNKNTKVCSVHFRSDDFMEGARLKRLKKGVFPTLFEWNHYQEQPPRLSVWERRERPLTPDPDSDAEQEDMDFDVESTGHDYCSVPEAAAVDMVLHENEELKREIEDVRKQLEQTKMMHRFGLSRFAGSDEDIRFYTRFATYNHLMAFWELIEPATHRMIRVTNSKVFKEPGNTRALPAIDEFFLFLMHLALGLKQKDLGHRFQVHQTTVSRIITTWANFLYFVLGSVCIWMPKEKVRAHLPEEFHQFRDTQVILDCTEIRCHTPSSLLLQSEVFSNYKSHCTFKALVGMAPHGAITFVSALYAGSISDRELFKQSGIINLLTPDMAIMVDKGFLIDSLVPCKIHRPVFLTNGKQMSADEVTHTQSVARLRVHVERLIRRVKEHKLFDTIIPLSISGSINQLFTVACLLVNYQCGPLVKAWSH